MTVKRMDNVGIVVEDLDAAIAFFLDLGLTLEGRAKVEGEWAGRVTGLGDQEVEIAMMKTPDGHSRLELSRFIRPAVVADHRRAPVNALGYLRVMFAVTDLEDTLRRLESHGTDLVGDVVDYAGIYRLCYIRGPAAPHRPRPGIGLTPKAPGPRRLSARHCIRPRDDLDFRPHRVNARALLQMCARLSVAGFGVSGTRTYRPARTAP